MRTNKAWKGCAAGLAGGLAATLVMTGFQTAWNAATKEKTSNGGRSDSRRAEDSGKNGQEMGQQSQPRAESENPTEKVASKVVGIAGTELSPDGKKTGGTVVHYAFGTLMGAVYGTALEFAPREYRRKALGSGLLLGTALFAAADEVALPALHLTEGPTEIPASMHVYGLVSHLVYGATTGLLTRTLRKVM
jgi:putative membrane protein